MINTTRVTLMRLPALSTLALAACAAGAALPRGVAVLPGHHAAKLLDQCSRDAPDLGEGTWQPGGADIRALEERLAPALIAEGAKADPDWSPAPRGWVRQYVGIVRGGRRLVYGSFFPSEAKVDRFWRKPLLVCDGGPAFFGVEYDVAAARFTHIAFNGSF